MYITCHLIFLPRHDSLLRHVGLHLCICICVSRCTFCVCVCVCVWVSSFSIKLMFSCPQNDPIFSPTHIHTHTHTHTDTHTHRSSVIVHSCYVPTHFPCINSFFPCRELSQEILKWVSLESHQSLSTHLETAVCEQTRPSPRCTRIMTSISNHGLILSQAAWAWIYHVKMRVDSKRTRPSSRGTRSTTWSSNHDLIWVGMWTLHPIVLWTWQVSRTCNLIHVSDITKKHTHICIQTYING